MRQSSEAKIWMTQFASWGVKFGADFLLNAFEHVQKRLFLLLVCSVVLPVSHGLLHAHPLLSPPWKKKNHMADSELSCKCIVASI